MIEKISLETENFKGNLLTFCISGKRLMDVIVDDWLEIKNRTDSACEIILIRDSMTGKLSTERICLLVEILSGHNFFFNKKIAVILTDINSYSSSFFDVFAKNWGINMKHFADEKDAINWLQPPEKHLF